MFLSIYHSNCSCATCSALHTNWCSFFFWKSWHIFLSSYWLIFMSASSPFWQPSCCVCLSTCVCVSFRMVRWLESTLLKWQQEFPSLYRQTASAAFSQSHRLNTRKMVTFFVKFIILLSKISLNDYFPPVYVSNFHYLLLWLVFVVTEKRQQKRKMDKPQSDAGERQDVFVQIL